MKRSILFAALFINVGLAGQAWAKDVLKNPPVVPSEFRFVRTLDVDGYLQDTNQFGTGAQSLRVRTRYLDPDVNAFVGLLTGITRFNRTLLLNPQTQETGKALWTWGGDMGIRRGKHLWELDLMGAVLGTHLGAAVGVVGEHDVTRRVELYHRTEIDVFVGNTLGDADQGVNYHWNSFGVEAGYRLFAGQHFHRSGPHIGLTYRFESEKIPFLYPSMG